MLYSPPSTRPFPAVLKPAINWAQALFSRLSTWRRERAQRAALRSLLQFDAALLDDLGIERCDVVDALHWESGYATLALDLRRAERARRRSSHR